MKNLILLLVVSCLAVSEACSSGASGGGGNGWPYWESTTNRRVAPYKMSANGRKVVGKALDTGAGFLATPTVTTDIPGVYEFTSLSPNGRWGAGSAYDGSGTKAVLYDFVNNEAQYVLSPDYAIGYTADDNGTLGFDAGGSANRAMIRLLGGQIIDLSGGFIQSFPDATTASGSAIAIGAKTVSGGPTNAYWYDGTSVQPAPLNGDTYCVARSICDAFLVGESGTLLAYKPFKWGPADPAKTILPGYNGVVKGSALCVANYPAVKLIGGYLTNSPRYAIVWLDNGAGGWVAREIKPLLLEAGYALGPKLLTAVLDVSPTGQYVLVRVIKSLTDDSYSTAVVLNTWFGTNLGQVKTQAVGSAVVITNRVVIAAPPDALYVENDDRSAGIRINLTGHTVNVGDRISVSGTLAEINGEKVVTGQLASLKVFPGIWPSPKPVTVPNNLVASSIGLCNAGQLVRTIGTVREHRLGCFIIDDGSAVENGGTTPGLTVILPAGVTAPAVGQFVSVCGVSTKSGDAYPCLRIRSAADIQVP